MRRYPQWLKQPFSPDGTARTVRSLVEDLDLVTVCESALCPNLRECYSQRQLTFMILGDACTRNCRFCAVEHGRTTRPLDHEPEHLAEAVRRLGLAHVVITSVARDDMPDEGAGHFAEVLKTMRALNPGVTVEVLVPDFHGRPELIERVMAEAPEVFAHNLETVERLSPRIRSHADYRRSLDVLHQAAQLSHETPTTDRTLIKTSLMLGLGETDDELRSAFGDAVEAGCTHLTLGQYLRPTPDHLPVLDYVTPDQFASLERLAYAAGFRWVKAGPFVRSSYHAIDALTDALRPEVVT